MDTPVSKPVGNESHYHSKKDRVFVRGIEGQYSLKDELARLRAQPRVIKGKEIKFNDGPQTFSRHARGGLRPKFPRLLGQIVVDC